MRLSISLILHSPDSHGKPFIDMMFGRIKDVYANIEILSKDQMPKGNYLEDKQFKHDFTMYIRDLWEQKDHLLDKLHEEYKNK